MPGPDLPLPHGPITLGAYWYRWPSGAEKVELIDGVLLFTGAFDGRDVEIARRTYPGRHVLLDTDGSIEVHPAGDTPPRPLSEVFAQRPAQQEDNLPG